MIVSGGKKKQKKTDSFLNRCNWTLHFSVLSRLSKAVLLQRKQKRHSSSTENQVQSCLQNLVAKWTFSLKMATCPDGYSRWLLKLNYPFFLATFWVNLYKHKWLDNSYTETDIHLKDQGFWGSPSHSSINTRTSEDHRTTHKATPCLLRITSPVIRQYQDFWGSLYHLQYQAIPCLLIITIPLIRQHQVF